MKAPPDFESRLARAIAERRGRGRFGWWPGVWPSGIRTAAVSGSALLLVGVLSFLVFRGGSEIDTLPRFDGADPPANAPADAGNAAPAETPEAKTTPAESAPETSPAPSAPVERREAGPAPGRKVGKTVAPPAVGASPSVGAPPATAPRDATEPPAAARAKSKTTAPLLLMERAGPDSAALFFPDTSDSNARWRDSARIVDSLLRLRGLPRLDSLGRRDTLETHPDSLFPHPRL